MPQHTRNRQQGGSERRITGSVRREALTGPLDRLDEHLANVRDAAPTGDPSIDQYGESARRAYWLGWLSADITALRITAGLPGGGAL